MSMQQLDADDFDAFASPQVLSADSSTLKPPPPASIRNILGDRERPLTLPPPSTSSNKKIKQDYAASLIPNFDMSDVNPPYVIDPEVNNTDRNLDKDNLNTDLKRKGSRQKTYPVPDVNKAKLHEDPQQVENPIAAASTAGQSKLPEGSGPVAAASSAGQPASSSKEPDQDSSQAYSTGADLKEWCKIQLQPIIDEAGFKTPRKAAEPSVRSKSNDARTVKIDHRGNQSSPQIKTSAADPKLLN